MLLLFSKSGDFEIQARKQNKTCSVFGLRCSCSSYVTLWNVSSYASIEFNFFLPHVSNTKWSILLCHRVRPMKSKLNCWLTGSCTFRSLRLELVSIILNNDKLSNNNKPLVSQWLSSEVPLYCISILEFTNNNNNTIFMYIFASDTLKTSLSKHKNLDFVTNAHLSNATCINKQVLISTFLCQILVWSKVTA